MPYNPEIHKKQSIRLKGYDYTREGLYFITICVQNRECLFGKIENGEMELNDIGIMADKYWIEIPNHYPQVTLHEHIVMPNHIHGIIEIIGNRHDVGICHDDAGICHDGVGICHGKSLQDTTDNIVGTCHGMSLQQPHERQFAKPIAGSVSTIINQYKSAVKRWCNKNNCEYFQWQPRFHDHIIRNEQSYETISNYIINNPAKWQEDKFYAV